jgi:hypothetical protein
LSVPPPGPAVATNSIGLLGRHSAAAGAANSMAMAPTDKIIDFAAELMSPPFL